MPDATPSKRAALKTIFAKLTKLIPHFANDNDSEALAALRKATRFSLRQNSTGTTSRCSWLENRSRFSSCWRCCSA